MAVRPDGPIPARILICGEAPGADEEREGVPFVGASGQELNRMLHEAGIMRSECFVTNVVRVRPPGNDISAFIPTKKKDITSLHVPLRDKMVLPPVVEGYNQLLSEISLVKPDVIVALGNTPLWALTGNWGITKWRGSLLSGEGLSPSSPTIIPTYHPAAVLRQWDWRAVAVADLRRAKKILDVGPPRRPAWRFSIRPSFSQVISILQSLEIRLAAGEELWLDLDLETKAGHIACCGISWTRLDALCIPFMVRENKEGYWPPDEEASVIYQLYRVLTHPRVKVRWQNGLYDAQYIYRHWHFIPRGVQDTMISQHALFVALPKSLAFQASMYAEWYVYWKDEGKNLDGQLTDDRNWAYNCQDCVYTREVGETQLRLVEDMKQQSVHSFQQRLFYPVLKAMTRGIKVIDANQKKLMIDIQEELSAREAFLYEVLGHAFNPGSPVQMQKLFYEDFAMKPIMKVQILGGHRVSRPTCDDEALQTLAAREPLLRPIINAISDIRTLGVWMSTFIMAKRDVDGRMRCGYNIGGNAQGKSAPYSFRLSSNKNAFDTGANLQNIPSEKSKSAGKAKQRGSMSFELPNIRSMYGPDPGFTFFDMDLDRADLQVVVWEAEDEMLKAALRLGADIHLLNVFVIDGQEPPPLEELVESHPKYADHRGPRKHKREFAKVFCHATNYVGSAKTVAGHTGRTVHEIDRAQKIWFGAHPGIKALHQRVEEQIRRRRFVENRFGYRWHIFDRVDGLLPEAVAWIPQSTVGCTVNRIWVNLDDNLREVQVLGQVHDSLFGQFPTHAKETIVRRIREEALKVVIPYDDPLIIPVGVKTSEKSWGECE